MGIYLNAYKAVKASQMTKKAYAFDPNTMQYVPSEGDIKAEEFMKPIRQKFEDYQKILDKEGPQRLVDDIRKYTPRIYDKAVHALTKPVSKDALAGTATAAGVYAATPFIKDKVLRTLLAVPAGVGGAMAREPVEDLLRNLVDKVKKR